MHLKVHLTFKKIRTNGAAAGASRCRHFYDIIFLMKNVVNVRKSSKRAVFISIFNQLLWIFSVFYGMFHEKALCCQFSTDGLLQRRFPPLGGILSISP